MFFPQIMLNRTVSFSQRPRNYKQEIEYSCPTGYVMDRTGLDPATYPEASKMRWRCEVWGDWGPHVRPRCVRKCLTLQGDNSGLLGFWEIALSRTLGFTN